MYTQELSKSQKYVIVGDNNATNIKTIYNIISVSKLHKDDYLTHLRTHSTHTL